MSRIDDESDQAALNTAIGILERVERASPNGQPVNQDELDLAISKLETALDPAPPGAAQNSVLDMLGRALLARFEQSGDRENLSRAVQIHRTALALLPDEHATKRHIHDRFGITLRYLFQTSDDRNSIEESVENHQSAIRLTPDRHPFKTVAMNNLGLARMALFDQLGEITALDAAIIEWQRAIDLATPDVTDKANPLINLGSALLKRFKRLNDAADLHRSITVLEHAADIVPKSHPNEFRCFVRLSGSLYVLFTSEGRLTDLESAISWPEKAVKLPATQQDQAGALCELATFYAAMFERSTNLTCTHIDRAIELAAKAFEQTEDSARTKPVYATALGTFYDVRFDDTFVHTDVSDIDHAILAFRDALRLTPPDHPDRPQRHLGLGMALVKKARWFPDAQEEQQQLWGICNEFASGARSPGDPLCRFYAASAWAVHSPFDNRVEAYGYAISLFSRIAWRELPVASRYEQLKAIRELVKGGVAAALRSGERTTALEWLEQGRSIASSQIFQRRTPRDVLRERDPTLADQLDTISRALEALGMRNGRLSMEEAGTQNSALDSAWDGLVGQIRKMEGFEDFLQPKKIAQLMPASVDSPVVLINAHEVDCYAFVLMHGNNEAVYIDLDSSVSKAENLRTRFHDVCHDQSQLMQRHVIRLKKMQPPKAVSTEFEEILGELWTTVVKPVLEGLGFSPSREENLPRIWWCPTGPFAFLPLHAAGLYNTDEFGTKTPDYVVSSYTPTITALLEARRPVTSPSEFSMLAVTQPTTPDQRPLPGAIEELARLQHYVGNLPLEVLDGSEASSEKVVTGMSNNSWVHLACHGTQELGDPTRSALIVHQEHLDLERVIQARLSNAVFAFLSACQTPSGELNVGEESFPLAAGMLLAGYRGVIATSWPIRDGDAPTVADAVYADILKNGNPNPSRAAHALQKAVHNLRREGLHPFFWAPFIHFGI